MADKKDLENMMQQADQPFSSPAFDTFTAAWAVSQRKKKAATKAQGQASPEAAPDDVQSVESDPDVLRRRTETLFQGPVLDTFTAAWAASKDKIKSRKEPKPDNSYIVRQIYTHLLMAGVQGDVRPILQPLSEDVEWQSPGPVQRFPGLVPCAGANRSCSGSQPAEKQYRSNNLFPKSLLRKAIKSW